MSIPGILPQQVDAQLQGQVPLPQGIQPQQIVPQQVQAQPQPIPQGQIPVQPQQAAPPAQAPQPPPEPVGPLGIPNSQLVSIFEKTKDPNARLQAATFLGSTVPAPTDEELDNILNDLDTGGA